jgi:diguanylate cyclase (GGDEF)-like protein
VTDDLPDLRGPGPDPEGTAPVALGPVTDMIDAPSLGRDLAWMVAVTALVTLVIDQTGVVEPTVGAINSSPFSSILVLSIIAPVAGALFALRRYREAAGVRKELARLSMHDSLTGLPNRRFLGDGFRAVVRRARRQGSQVGVFFVDLDKFKAVNDTYGHEVGDRLMVAVSRRIEDLIGPEDTAVRYGGDEFVIVTPTLANQSTAERLARRVIESIERPFEFGDDRIQISASVGVALTEESQADPEDVIRDADSAMYAAKARGGNGVVAVFDDSVPDRMTSSTAEKRLRRALDDEEFRLVYQPVVSLQTQRMVKVEALLRWEDPERGVIGPGQFIPALEETGLIVPAGTWALEEACRQACTWQQRYTHHAPLTVNVNVSARQLGQYDFVDVLHRTLERTGVDPSLICLEITEGALMSDVDTAWTMLRQAKGLGVYLALDDFGTGFSSLSFLRQFSLDIVKIDKSFVDGLGESREDTTIIEHVVGMARGLGMVTVAEGVETADQVRYLRSLECHMAQGYFYSRPQTPDVVDRIMGQRNGAGAVWQPDGSTPHAASV